MPKDTFPVNINGTREFPIVAFPDGLTNIKVSIAMHNQANRTLRGKLDISYDGGATWTDLFTLNPYPGGEHGIKSDGTSDVSVVIDVPPDVNRLLRATLTSTGGAISTQISIATS